MKKNMRKWIQIGLIILDVLLIGALAGVMYLEKRRESKSGKALSRAVSVVQAEVNAAAAALATESDMMSSETISSMSNVEEMAMLNGIAEIPKKISVRGDSFTIEGGDPQSTYPAILQRMLLEGGSEQTVLDYTLDNRNVMTHMYYAGVPMADIQAFVNKNRSSADPAISEDPAETQLGNVSDLVLDRYDRDAIPIIFVGNCGGWGKNVFQLIEMQRSILSTYDQKDLYMIIGTHFFGYEDVDSFDKLMASYWGGHYLDASQVSGASLNTLTGHERLCVRIVERLKKLGYFSVTAMAPDEELYTVG